VSALLAVRHSSAGDRAAWVGDDDQRPLDDLGQRQAQWLVDVLSGRRIGRILSSPATRCVQTVEPLATARGVALELEPALAEGTSTAVLPLVRGLGMPESDVVLCSHGDVIGALVGVDRPCRKGSVWVLERVADGWEPAEYLKPRR
jgi:broad specificity phosphatase PhoE